MVAMPHFFAGLFMYGAAAEQLMSAYPLFSITIQTTCLYRTGGLRLVPQGPPDRVLVSDEGFLPANAVRTVRQTPNTPTRISTAAFISAGNRTPGARRSRPE